MARVTLKTVDPSVLAALNAGTRATANLVEALALDMGALIRTLGVKAPGLERACAEKAGVVARMKLGGAALLEGCGRRGRAKLASWGAHPSDTVRGWCCYAVGLEEGVSLPDRLARIRPFAADAHFGVREWAWMAVRPHLAAELDLGLTLLSTWTADANDGVRRFASEATRPRGVWCGHLETLKRDPSPGMAVLELLRSDPSRYVQDSVGNWLNDAGKTRPDWVREVTTRWLRESRTAETTRTVRRATRGL